MEQSKHLIIVAGEASGDLHASRLVDSLKQLSPKMTFCGLGGELMQKSGVVLYENLTNFAVVGFFEVIKHWGNFQRIFKMILEKIQEMQPDAVVLVDYPGFNLCLARAIKQANLKTKIIYYISPQVWAWKESRVKLIKNVVDKMLVILPFEKEFYARWGMDVKFVGHPLLDSIQLRQPPEHFLTSVGLSPSNYTIALLPGSREKEIERILPVMLQTAGLLYSENKKLQFLLIQAPTIAKKLLEKYLSRFSMPLKVIDHNNYDAINASQICLVTSGTATLETAILLKPMVVVYKTSFFTWALAKVLVKIPYIGLVNVVAGKKIVEECVQSNATPKKISAEIKSIYTNEIKIADIKSELRKVKESLGEPGASLRAAELILKFLCRNRL